MCWCFILEGEVEDGPGIVNRNEQFKGKYLVMARMSGSFCSLDLGDSSQGRGSSLLL